jgi:hypothetical protein
MDPLLFSKILAAGLFAIPCTVLYALLRSESGLIAAWTGCAFCWISPLFMYNISGGLARGFASPLMALFLVSWQRRQYLGVCCVLFLQALFIPYIFAICGLALGIAWGGAKVKLFREPVPLLAPANLIIVVSGACVVLAWKHQMAAYGFGPLASGQMLLRPEFSELGRFPVYPPASLWQELIQPFGFLLPFRDGGIAAGIVVLVILVAILISSKAWRHIKFRMPSGLSLPLSCLAMASLVLYLTARGCMLKLFIPSRYISYSWELILVLGLALALSSLLMEKKLGKLALMSLLAFSFVVGMIRNHGEGLKNYSGGSALYAAIRKTPKKALFFGNPLVLDNVLTFGRRNAFATYELAHPWSTGYWQHYKDRLDASFRYYYGNDLPALKAFCQQQSINYVVVDKRDFAEAEKPRSFFEPYDTLIKQLREKGGPFVLASESPFPVVWQDGRYVLLDVGGDRNGHP